MQLADPVPPLQPISSIEMKDRPPLPDFLRRARSDQHAVRQRFKFKQNHDAYMNILEAGNAKPNDVIFKNVSSQTFELYARRFPDLSRAINTAVLALEVSGAIVVNTWVESEYIFPAAWNWVVAMDQILPKFALLLRLMPESQTAGEPSLTQADVDSFLAVVRKLNTATLVYALCLRLIGAKMARKTEKGAWSDAQIDVEASTDPFLTRLQTDATMFRPTMFQSFCESVGFAAEETKALLSGCVAFSIPLAKCMALAALHTGIGRTISDLTSVFGPNLPTAPSDSAVANGAAMSANTTNMRKARQGKPHQRKHADPTPQSGLPVNVKRRETAAHKIFDQFTGKDTAEWLGNRWSEKAEDAANISKNPSDAAMLNQVKQQQREKAEETVQRYRDVGNTALDVGTAAFDEYKQSQEPKKEAGKALGYALLAGNVCQVGSALVNFWLAPNPLSATMALMKGISANQDSITKGAAALAGQFAPVTGGGSLAAAGAVATVVTGTAYLTHALSTADNLMQGKGIGALLMTIAGARWKDFVKVVENIPFFGFLSCMDSALNHDAAVDQEEAREKNVKDITGFEPNFWQRLGSKIYYGGWRMSNWVGNKMENAGHAMLGEESNEERAARYNVNPSVFFVSPAGCRLLRATIDKVYNFGPGVVYERTLGAQHILREYCIAGFGHLKSALEFFMQYLPDSVRDWLNQNPVAFAEKLIDYFARLMGLSTSNAAAAATASAAAAAASTAAAVASEAVAKASASAAAAADAADLASKYVLYPTTALVTAAKAASVVAAADAALVGTTAATAAAASNTAAVATAAATVGGWTLLLQVMFTLGLFALFVYFCAWPLLKFLSKIFKKTFAHIMDFFQMGDPWSRPSYKKAFQQHMREYTRAPLEAMKRLAAKTTPIELTDLETMHRAVVTALETSPEDATELDAIRRRLEKQMRKNSTSVFRPMEAKVEQPVGEVEVTKKAFRQQSEYLQN